MKIWIDIINTPQVSFFIPFIKDFERENHEIIITCRDSGNSVDLLNQNNIQFHIIGKKEKKGSKHSAFVKRLIKLYKFVKAHKIDIAVGQSSFYQPIVAKYFNIPCLYTNDNEHAKGNLFGFLFATKVILPVALKNESFTKKWALKSRLTFYPSVKEAIYLSKRPELLELLSGKKTTIYFRPEPWTAQYYSGPVNFLDDILLKLADHYKVIVLPRDKKQGDHYKEKRFLGISVASKPLNLQDILSDCLLFIGAGGSMTRELAVMGIPVISIYQDELLRVDRYLAEKGRLTVNPQVTYEEIQKLLDSNLKPKTEWEELNDGKKSYLLIKEMLENLHSTNRKVKSM